MPFTRHHHDKDDSPRTIWRMFNAVETEAVINALRRWQISFSMGRRALCVGDPFVRLVLDRCLPSEVEDALNREPLDGLMQDVIAVRTKVLDECLLEWVREEGVRQVVILGSGMDTRAWRLPWPPGVKVFEIDSAMIQMQKFASLGDVDPNCHRVALVGDVYNLGAMLRSLQRVTFESSQQVAWLLEDVVEFMQPQLASQMFCMLYDASAPGSRMVVTLSDMKLRDTLRRYGHAAHGGEGSHEAPSVVLNRIIMAGWSAELILSGQLDSRFDVDLHGMLYIVRAWKGHASPPAPPVAAAMATAVPEVPAASKAAAASERSAAPAPPQQQQALQQQEQQQQQQALQQQQQQQQALQQLQQQQHAHQRAQGVPLLPLEVQDRAAQHTQQQQQVMQTIAQWQPLQQQQPQRQGAQTQPQPRPQTQPTTLLSSGAPPQQAQQERGLQQRPPQQQQQPPQFTQQQAWLMQREQAEAAGAPVTTQQQQQAAMWQATQDGGRVAQPRARLMDTHTHAPGVTARLVAGAPPPMMLQEVMAPQ